MNSRLRHTSLTVGLLLLMAGVNAGLLGTAQAQPGQLTVKVDQPGVKISPTFYGLMTEEINHSYDGGLYAELVQNRVFKDNATQPVHWSLLQLGGGTGTIGLDTTQPLNASLPVSLKLEVANPGQGVGVTNDGYWGIPVKPNTAYRATFYARGGNGFAGPLHVSLDATDAPKSYAGATIAAISGEWRQYTVVLKTAAVAPTATNRLAIWTDKPGTVWLNLVSLMPPTYHDRPNGNRPDLMQLLGDMKPAFLRLPGGNYLEGNTIPERFDWKKTIGPLEQRPGHQCPWGYRSTDGMGLLEYVEWCEDLKMEPVLAVYAGYSLRQQHINPGPDLAPFVQDGLDEIEYVTGAATTRWGAERVKDGHPLPFPLHYVEVGNEDGADRSGSYDGRFTQFFDAIKAKYPQLQIIATAGVRMRKPDVIDDHYYRSASAMERDVHHYDRTDRTGPKIFVGEWASTEGSPTPTLQAALGDAAWLTGLERNSDVVVLESYAPLLVNVNPSARQWGTNLVGYDAISSFGSPSYYVQKMFGNNRGDVVLPVDIVPQAVAASAAFAPQGAIGVGTWLTQAEYKDVTVTQDGKTLLQSDFTNGTRGWRLRGGAWKAQDGALAQSSPAENVRATAGDATWTDYTLNLKARKTGGQEGFLVMFHVQDPDNYVWWNIGGWGNTRSALERAHNGAKEELGASVPVTVETGRWYDIRVEVKGQNIRCYLDGKLITETTDTPGAPAEPLYSTASRDLATGDVILKVVNVSAAPQQLTVKLQGVAKLAGAGSGEVLAGEPGDVNTVAEPRKVAPQPITVAATGSVFAHEFPARSVSVLRLKVK